MIFIYHALHELYRYTNCFAGCFEQYGSFKIFRIFNLRTKTKKGDVPPTFADTLPETNVAPENGSSQKEISSSNFHFQGLWLLVSGGVNFGFSISNCHSFSPHVHGGRCQRKRPAAPSWRWQWWSLSLWNRWLGSMANKNLKPKGWNPPRKNYLNSINDIGFHAWQTFPGRPKRWQVQD